MSDNIRRKVLWEQVHPLYVEKIENWWLANDPAAPPTKMHSAYNHQGDYIGDINYARQLCDKYGIAPEKASPEHSVCSIGYCAQDNKWYGWSHRNIVGFGLGDKIFEADFGDETTPYVQHGRLEIGSPGEAKLAARRYAESVANTLADALATAIANVSNVELRQINDVLIISKRRNDGQT